MTYMPKAAFLHVQSLHFLPLSMYTISLYLSGLAAEGQSRDDQVCALFCGADLQRIGPVICVYPSLHLLWRRSIAGLPRKHSPHSFLQIAVNVPCLVQHLPDATPGLLICMCMDTGDCLDICADRTKACAVTDTAKLLCALDWT